MEGEIKSIRNTRQLIAKFPELPPISAQVFDNKGKKIGIVTWIFGPVKSPLVEIKLDSEMRRMITVMNEKIYVEEI